MFAEEGDSDDDISELEVVLRREETPSDDQDNEEDPREDPPEDPPEEEDEDENFEEIIREVTERRRASMVQVENKDRKHHHHRRHHKKTDTEGTSEKVKVIVRCRPLSEKEKLQGHSRIIQISDNRKTIEVHRPNPSSGNFANAKVDKAFTFDSVYDERTSQGELYEEAFSDLVDSVLEGFNGTIFAYGQTGTGKTYTMEGVREIREEQGVIPNAFRHIFERISDSPDLTYLVRASYLEIYQEEVKDLLSPKLKVCELKENSDGVYIKGLSSFLCRDFEEINKLMSRGNTHRSIGATNMNEHSSRSHAVFMIAVEMSEIYADGEAHIRVGRLNLVDLAGSERQGKTGAEGERLKEAVKINLSLSALGNVIGALADGKNGHIPYRDSKLTRLLQDSLGGNSRTVMVATVGPASFNYDETMVTLRYASRAKRIKNKPKINEDPKDAMLRNYQQEIAKLRAMLGTTGGHRPGSGGDEDHGGEGGRVVTGRKYGAVFDQSLTVELEQYLEEGSDEVRNDPGAVLKVLGEKRTALLGDTATAAEEKERLLGKLESTTRKVVQAQTDCGQLHDRIEWFQSKVLNAGKTLSDHTNEQRQEIEERQKEMDEEQSREDEIRDRMEKHDLSVTELQDMDKELERSVEVDTKRLRKVQAKIYKIRKDREERGEKHSTDVAKLQRFLAHNQKQNELNKGILDNFVPPKMTRRLASLLQHNPSDDTVNFMPMTSIVLPRPKVNRMSLLPLFNKSGSPKDIRLREHFHYTDENILQVHPIPPVSEIGHYVPPDTDPHIKSVIMRALAEAEKEVSIDCHRINLTSTKRRAKTARVRLGEILTFENNLTVRQVLSAKHRSKEIPYKDFVAVMRVDRGQSAIPFKNQLRRANHISLSPDFLLVPPPPFTAPRKSCNPPHPPHLPSSSGDFSGVKSGSTLLRHLDESGSGRSAAFHLEEKRPPSTSTSQISLRKLQQVMAKRKMLANLQQQLKPSLSDYSRASWTSSLYSETPPSTANPQFMEPEEAKRGNRTRSTAAPPFSNILGHAPGRPLVSNEPGSSRSLKSLTPETNCAFREARHFGTGNLRRDPLTARTNSYPPGTSGRSTGNPSRSEQNRSCMDGGNLHPRDPWARLDPHSQYGRSLGFTSPPPPPVVAGTDFGPKFLNHRPSTPVHSSNFHGKGGYSPLFKMTSPSSPSFRLFKQV